MRSHMLRGAQKPVAATDLFSPTIYTGNGANRSIGNGIDLSAYGGLVWTKARATTGGHGLIDSVRGANKDLGTEVTDGEATLTGAVTAFDPAGYSLGTNTAYNNSGTTYVSWTFRKYASFFDIVTYTGNGANRTIGHSLTAAPELIIVKERSGVGNWSVYHKDALATRVLYLNLIDASAPSTAWNNTAPTASVFSLGSLTSVNNSGDTFVAYLFTSLAGICKIGKYTGNGAASQTIDCGFTAGARFVLIKRESNTNDWFIWDTARGIVAGADPRLRANSNGAEGTLDDEIDFTPSGFVINDDVSGLNNLDAVFIYMAIA